MSIRSERIKSLIENSEKTYQELEKVTGIKKSSLQRYASGTTPKIPLDVIERLSVFFNVSKEYLMGWEDTPNGETSSRFLHSMENYSLASSILAEIRPITKKRLPLLGNVACGEPIFANEDHESYIEANADLDADFCLTAKGDSMINARIFDGDILFVKAQGTVENGEIAVVLIDNEATVKRVYYDKENNVITLVPENPTHKPLRYTGEQLNQIRILGKVISGQYTVE